MGFGAAVASGFTNYARFSGRACRSEYWWWGVFYVLVGIGATIAGWLSLALGIRSLDGIIHAAAELAMLLPNLAISVRRLHDLDRSGWWLGASFILIIFLLALGAPVAIRMDRNYNAGASLTDGLPTDVFIILAALALALGVLNLLLIIWYCMAGTRGQNRFGPDPLA